MTLSSPPSLLDPVYFKFGEIYIKKGVHVIQSRDICHSCLTLQEWTLNAKNHWWESSRENFIEGFDKQDGFNTGSE